MKKTQYIALIVVLLMIFVPNFVRATEEVTVSRNVYSQNGSMKFTFSGLTLDLTHEYEFGITKTVAETVTDWYEITELTENTATVDVTTGTSTIKEITDAVDTAYITIKDKTADNVIVEPYSVDLKMPYLMVTSYEIIENGKDIWNNEIMVPLRNAANSEAYYKYEKITDENLINKYKEIKANSGDYSVLASMIKTTVPISGYSTWVYWNGHIDGESGYGCTTRTVNAPNEGLYYLWLHFASEEDGLKDIYGCILVDNLQPEIAVESISLPATKTVELGKTITLEPTFNPSTATNKIVTWTSSDEKVATVDNAGKITPIKVGSTIITVTTQDGNKTATCTVTVTKASSNNPGNDIEDTDNESANSGNTNNGSTSSGSTNSGSTSSGNTNSGNTSSESTDKTNDKTTSTGKIPQTGVRIEMIISVLAILGIGIYASIKYRSLKNI